MPTYTITSRFRKDYNALSTEQQHAFRRVLPRFIEDTAAGRYRRGLRVKGVRALPGHFEMTWAPNGRAIFMPGEEVRPNEPHIVWIAIGTHDILP